MDILNKFVGSDLTKVTIREIVELDNETEKAYEHVIYALAQDATAIHPALRRLERLKDIKTSITKANRMKNIKVDKNDLIEELYKKLDL